MPLNVEEIRAICFDMDGTLSDTDDVMVGKLVRMLKPVRFFFPKQDIPRIARRIIMAIEAPANLLMGVPDFLGLDEPLARLHDFVSRHVGSKPRRDFLLVSGVQEMLAELSLHYPMALVSVRDTPTTVNFLEQFNLSKYFKCVATAQTCKHTKPFPDPILWAAEQMQVPPKTCLMVGDTSVDIRAGKSAGSKTVGVLCGFGREPELRRFGADMILATTSDLVKVLM